MKNFKTPEKTVKGVHAKAPRPTLIGALWLFCMLAVPVYLGLSLIDWLV
jgi:hypothetical protein